MRKLEAIGFSWTKVATPAVAQSVAKADENGAAGGSEMKQAGGLTGAQSTKANGAEGPTTAAKQDKKKRPVLDPPGAYSADTGKDGKGGNLALSKGSAEEERA